MATRWEPGASAAKRLLDYLKSQGGSGGGSTVSAVETVNVQEYTRPDGTTKRVVEETVVDGKVVSTVTTNFAAVIVEADDA